MIVATQPTESRGVCSGGATTRTHTPTLSGQVVTNDYKLGIYQKPSL